MPESEKEEEPFTSRFAGVKIDWPRTIGYYGAVAAAVAFDIIAPPLGAFIAVVPLLKFVKRPNAPPAERFLAAILEGAGKPVGGDAEGVLRPAWIDDGARPWRPSRAVARRHRVVTSAAQRPNRSVWSRGG